MLLSEMEDAVLLEPGEDGVAVPGADHRGHRLGPRGSLIPGDAEAEEGRYDCQAQRFALGQEVLDRSEHSIARPPLARGSSAVGERPRPDPRLVGVQAAALGNRLPMFRRYPLDRVVVVATPVRPTHVVKDQQRQLAL